MLGYCSWCFKKTEHALTASNVLRRNVWKCTQCKHHTLLCRSIRCQHFTRGRPPETASQASGTVLDRFRANWDSEYCAEHDGSIASFERLGQQLTDLQDFRSLYTDRKFNLVKTGTIGASIIGGVVVVGATAGAGVPAFAAAMGKLGLLGAASTGTFITTLSGAALTSASLAAIGSGGVFFMTAAGAALGGVLGGVVSNQYVGEIKDFDIIQYNEGDDTSVIFVNGFLNQDNDNLEDWRRGARKAFKSNAWYLTRWESKKKAAIGKTVCGSVGKTAASAYFTQLAKQASRKAGSKINPLAMAALAADLLGNDWHSAMAKAAMTGILLADLIARTPGKKYVLVGHSLGARVIYYTLETLATRTGTPVVQDVILLGGAVGAEDEAGWGRAADAVSGKIHNCFSTQDTVLKAAYQCANAFLSEPIGMRKINSRKRKIKNWDCSSFIDGHMAWKPRFEQVLDHIGYQYAVTEKAVEETA